MSSSSAVTNSAPQVRGEYQTGAGRRIGYAVAVAVNGALLYLINIAPGWESWDFLTPATADVLGLVNASLWVGVGLNLVYLIVDTRLVKAMGDTITAGFAVAVLVELLQVFPFDATGGWEWLLRAFLAVALFGSAIGVLGGLARIMGALLSSGRD